MVALITSDFQIPNNIAQGIFKKAQTGSVIARLSGASPQKFGTETNWALTAAPKAEIVGEGRRSGLWRRHHGCLMRLLRL